MAWDDYNTAYSFEDDDEEFEALREFLTKAKNGELHPCEWVFRVDNDCFCIEPKERPDGKPWEDEAWGDWEDWEDKCIHIGHNPEWVFCWLMHEMGFSVAGV